MKQLLILFLLLGAVCTLSFSQPSIVWSKALGSNNGEYSKIVRQTSDGGFIVAGYTESNGGDVMGYHGNPYVNDIWIVKLTQEGKVEWQKCLGGSFMEVGTDILQTNDGGYILAGSAASIDCDMKGNHGGLDYWVVKLDQKGEVQWHKFYGGPKTNMLILLMQQQMAVISLQV